MAHFAYLVLVLFGSGAAEGRPNSEPSARRLRGLKEEVSNEGVDAGWSSWNPDPEVLVWDEQVSTKDGLQSYFGWLKTPLVHDMAMLPYEEVPYVCLRVRAIPATEQPAKNGPLLFHCGGPGSGNECAADSSRSFDINGEGNQSRHKDFDWWSVDQRGVGTEGHSMNITTPPCPFNYSTGEPILPFPRMQCSLTLGANVSESAVGEAAPYVESILQFGGLQATASGKHFNETFVRWYYRLLKLEHGLCYNAPRFKLQSPSGREYNALQFGGTMDLAQDIDQFRRAVGAPHMSIYGASYGSAVAGVYGTIFAKYAKHLVLDGVLDPFPDVEERGALFIKAITATWNGITRACDLSAMDSSAEEPRPAAPLSESKALSLIQDSSDPSRASLIFQLLQRVFYGKLADMFASVLFACVEKHSAGRDVGCPDWLQSIVPDDDFGYSDWLDQVVASNETSFDEDWFRSGIHALVLGTDTAGRLNEEAFIRWWRMSMLTQPLATPFQLAWVVAISTWPATARPVPPMGDASIRPVIVGNLHDPRTAYTSAQLARRAFPQSHLITWQGIGHCLVPEGPVGKGLLAEYEKAKQEHHLMNYTEEMARYDAAVLHLYSYPAVASIV
ncbi:unnamed protein product [Symbiodinium sp. CCMP2456]|nr:unnamed protein product [Symbiodinium sp. CCMP2456]